MRAAALVLLRAFLAVLVRPDGDVLCSVVRGEVRAAHRNCGRADGQRGREDFLRSHREPAAADEAHRSRTPDHGRHHRGALERKLRRGKATPDLGQEREDLRHPRGASDQAVLDLGRAQRLEPGGHLHATVLEADGAGPVAGPVHQNPVGESHPPEPNLVPAHSPSVRATCMRKRVPSSRSSTGMRSSAEWISAAATSDSIARMGKNP